MNRKLLPTLIALATISAAHAADSVPVPTVYGKINVTLNKYEFDDLQGTPKTRVDGQDNWQLESNASRLGVKGDVPLVDGLKAVYKLEYEVFADGSNSNAFTQRNTYGGLQGDWGTLIAGKNDTPLKAISAETVPAVVETACLSTQIFNDSKFIKESQFRPGQLENHENS